MAAKSSGILTLATATATTIGDNSLATLTEHDADWPARRQLRLPALIFSGRKRHALDRLAADELHGNEIPRMRHPLWRRHLGADHHGHAVGPATVVPRDRPRGLPDLIYSAPAVAAPLAGRRTSQHSGTANIANQPEK